MNVNKTNKEIIDEISKIVEQYMKFNINDLFGDGYGIPQIEELDKLYFKYDTKNIKITKQKENELIEKVKELHVGEVNTWKINGIGKFMVVELYKSYKTIINKYNYYLDYKNENYEKINNIYMYLEQKIPIEFVGWVLFNKNYFV